ncbi:MAG TPA: sulfotransferase family 2 domain-containing protein [Xanthomonadaceae bacterium]|nr:sulfotransferase family 2 domain-containing protein [Xanthomonadaceae bacterium]
MIISHTHRYIFFAIPKTGTHSIRRALRPHLRESDLEQVGLFVNKSFPWPEIAAFKHGHITAQQIRPVLGAEAFDSYFKFAIVRNPFDRFVSYCAFVARTNGLFADDPRGFMRFILSQPRPFDHILFRPQSDFVADANGRLMVDFIGRAEHLQADYDRICERIGVPSIELERVNESSHRDYREYFDEELVAMVSKLYRADLELFDYAFDRDAAIATT